MLHQIIEEQIKNGLLDYRDRFNKDADIIFMGKPFFFRVASGLSEVLRKNKNGYTLFGIQLILIDHNEYGYGLFEKKDLESVRNIYTRYDEVYLSKYTTDIECGLPLGMCKVHGLTKPSFKLVKVSIPTFILDVYRDVY